MYTCLPAAHSCSPVMFNLDLPKIGSPWNIFQIFKMYTCLSVAHSCSPFIYIPLQKYSVLVSIFVMENSESASSLSHRSFSTNIEQEARGWYTRLVARMRLPGVCCVSLQDVEESLVYQITPEVVFSPSVILREKKK